MAKTTEERNDQSNQIQKARRRSSRDIAPLPKVVNQARRDKCRDDFKLFCETYYSNVFYIKTWSADHLEVLRLTEQAVKGAGGLFAVAMPRGGGKTAIALAACVWAVVYGHRRFLALIATSATRAVELLDNIKTELDTNDLLAEDFPEVCVPIRAIEGKANATGGQHHEGERTRIVWKQDQLTFPTICGSCSSGAVIKVGGITSGVRGLQIKRATDGATVRPDLVIIDDPQDDESANSPPQVAKRLKIISGAILGLAGPTRKIAGIMPVTVIAKDDLADRILDRKKYPQWRGVRFKLMQSMPTDAALWDQYAEIRAAAYREDKDNPDISKATAFYLANRAAMDKDAVASWPDRYNEDEASAIQNAMNLMKDDEAAFLAEYQNDPTSSVEENNLSFTAAIVLSKTTSNPKLERYIVPDDTTRLTAYMDVQGIKGGVIYYMVVAFLADFTAHIVDYGTFPDQPSNDFLLRNVKKTLARRNVSLEAALTKGLEDKSNELLGKDWQTESGDTIRISRLIIDAGYNAGVVKSFVKSSTYRALMLPSFGRAKDNIPMNEWGQKPGERVGWNWRVRAEGHALIETNQWKSFVAQRILSLPGDPGNLSIYKPPAKFKETQHNMLAAHCSVETPVIKSERFGDMVVWQNLRRLDNHLFDCLIGCYAGASEQGVLFTGHKVKADAPKKKVKKKLNVRW